MACRPGTKRVSVTERKFTDKHGNLKMKKKDLPKCPICGSEAFLNHDRIGMDYIQTLPEGSVERVAWEKYYMNQDAEVVDAGYSCGCKAYRPDDGIHNEPMAIGLKPRRAAMSWWIRKVDEINARNEVRKEV